MSSAKETKERYIQVSAEKRRDVNSELVHILNQAEQNHFEDTGSFDLRLHGNKRNDRNEMYRKRLTDADIEVLFLSFKGNSYITELDLGYNTIGDAGGIIIGCFLEDALVLKTLVLSYNDFGLNGAHAIAKGLCVNKTLNILKMDGNKFGIGGGMALASALQGNTTLVDLSINNTEQGTQSLIAIASSLQSNKTLIVLDIGRPILTSQQEESTVHVARMLETNRSIHDIHLSKHGITNFGAERLVEHIFKNETLLVLNLSCNSISRDGVKCLSQYLSSNPTLEVLNIGYNRAEDDGALHLSQTLSHKNQNLITLVLCNNSLTDKGLCAIAEALQTNITLKQLYVWGNNIGTAASQSFLDLTTKGELPRLALNDTDVSAYVVDGIPYLARVNSPY